MTLRQNVVARWLEVPPIVEEEATLAQRSAIGAPKTRRDKLLGLLPSAPNGPDLPISDHPIGELLSAPRPCRDPQAASTHIKSNRFRVDTKSIIDLEPRHYFSPSLSSEVQIELIAFGRFALNGFRNFVIRRHAIASGVNSSSGLKTRAL
ncbi:hypothetical protein [Corynebacterium callunae]|uniref:hypothetical protein n=1 Tax=Corynebacterium callunae TaxID=1721 RepID=UPI001FFE4C79|nr:hypothetical protein [Corynebacterium callunae]MCK2200504.1 hypothetical protein [Corynebacterium callunae]